MQHFLRLFRERFGVSPKAYQMSARVNEAARLLRSTDAPIKAVAYRLGFSDAKALVRALQHHLRVRPADLRMSSVASAGNTELVARPYPMNTHIVAPHIDSKWHDRYRYHGTGPLYPEAEGRTLKRAGSQKTPLV